MAITLNCDRCGGEFTRNNYRAARAKRHYCSKECAYASRRKDTIKTRYRMLNVGPNHPLSGKSGVVPEHRVLLYDHLGPGEQPCHWCQTNVDWRPGTHTTAGSLVVDHVDGDPKNNDLSNLVPSCHRCNTKRRLDYVRDDEPYVVVSSTGNRTRAVVRTCRTCGNEFITTPSAIKGKKNGGSYCSRACLHGRPSR